MHIMSSEYHKLANSWIHSSWSRLPMSFSDESVVQRTVCLVCQMCLMWLSLTWSFGPLISLTRLPTAEELVEGLQDAHNNLSDLLSTLPQKNVKISSAERPNSDILVFWGSQDCFSTDSCFVHCWIWGHDVFHSIALLLCEIVSDLLLVTFHLLHPYVQILRNLYDAARNGG